MTINAALDRRIDKVVRTHAKMRRNGVVHKVGPDGLIRSRPRLVRPRVPMNGILIIAALFFAFKALLFAQIGAGNYALKVQDLRQGTLVEQMGAALMQEEPITVNLGGYLKQFFFQR